MSEIKDCVEGGAGTCLNSDLIEALRAELATARQHIEQYKIARRAICEWTTDNDGAWTGACGAVWRFGNKGDPQDHGMEYCPHCGKLIVLPEPPDVEVN